MDVTIDSHTLKDVICDAMIAINNDVDPVTRDKWGPIIPPTAIDWIGNALVMAVLANTDPIHIEDHYNGEGS